jgi:hypothetical protein
LHLYAGVRKWQGAMWDIAVGNDSCWVSASSRQVYRHVLAPQLFLGSYEGGWVGYTVLFVAHRQLLSLPITVL